VEINIWLERFLVLLLAAGLVAIVTRRLRIPYTVGLVLAGIGLSFHPMFEDVPFTKDLIFNLFLPPLVFEAAIQIRWKELRKNLPVILLLATVGLCLSSAVTALGMKYVVGWDWSGALLFGALIAATDPVSVIATFKEAGVHGRLRLLVEAESLLNDGTAAVVFAVILAAVTGTVVPSIGGTVRVLASTVAGGILCGALVAVALSFLMWRAGDDLVLFTFTSVAAYSSFLLAEHFHFSGILACVTAGLIIGNTGPLADPSSSVSHAVEAYWEYMGFLANSLIFMGIGIHQLRQEIHSVLAPAGIAIIFVLLGRAFAVYPFCAVFNRSALKVSGRYKHVLFWGGLRGALALALALELPDSIPLHDTIVSVTFAVVAFSIFVQGLTMTPLLRRLGEIKGPAVSG
jgi:monovalent cation:H+ antiporter, CPA1 family